MQPFRCELHYYKPFSIDSSDKLKFSPGEIDFLWIMGKKVIPIEFKAQKQWAKIDTTVIEKFLKDNQLLLEIVFYRGVPYWDRTRKIYFWPYWGF